MLDGVSPSLIQGVSVIGILVLLLVTLIGALWKGLLYTRPQYDNMMKLQEARITDAKDREGKLQVLADTWQRAAEKAIANNEANVEQGKTIISLLQSIPRNPRR